MSNINTVTKITDNGTTIFSKEISDELKCPVCGKVVDYLVGENTPDGGRMGCEECWRPGNSPVSVPQSVFADPENQLNDFDRNTK